MRPVQLEPAPKDAARRLDWCVKMIENIARASQVNKPADVEKKNNSTFLKAALNLGDVADKAAAFNNIKQAGNETVTGVLRLATEAETVAGTSKEIAAHPAGVKAAFDAMIASIEEILDELVASVLLAEENLADVANAVEAFNNIKQAATEAATGVVQLASIAQIYAASAGALAVTAQAIAAASAPVGLTYGSTIALDWGGFINAEVLLQGNAVIGNPINGQPGTWRTIIVKGDSSTPRTVTFGDDYGGELPEIGDVTNSKWYELIIRCVNVNHFLVAARDASPPS